MKQFLRRVLPAPVVGFLKRTLLGNRHWSRIVRRSCGELLPAPTTEARAACEEIRRAYEPLLVRYGVPAEQFFEGSVKREDAATLYTMVRARRPGRAYQVGTFAGYSAMILAHALRANGSGILVCCDPEIPHRTAFNPVDVAREAVTALGLEGQIRFERGFHALPIGDPIFPEGLKREIPVVGRQILERLGEVDFAFVDGDHSTLAALADLELLGEFLPVGGVVVFHDAFSWPTVARALDLFFDDGYYGSEGAARQFRIDSRFGPDGLAAVERVAFPMHGMLRVKIVSATDGAPIARAEVGIVSSGFRSMAGADGAVFVFGGTSAETKLSVTAPGFASAEVAAGLDTTSRFGETTVRLAEGA